MCTGHIAFSQYYPSKYPEWNYKTSTCQLQVFEDYKICLQGLKSYQNEILLEADYDQIWPIRNRIILNKNENFSLLNCDLELITKDVYSNINVLLAPEKTFWKVSKNGKTGVIDNQGNLIIDLLYDEVEIINDIFQNRPKEDDKNYFKVVRNKNVGLISENGDVIFEPQYIDINFKQIVAYRYGQIPYQLFWTLNKKKGIELLNEKLEIIYSDTISSSIWFDSYFNESNIVFSFRMDSSLSRANNIFTNKSTDWLYGISRRTDGLVFGYADLNEQRTRVFNKDLNLILEMSRHDKLESLYRTNLFKHYSSYKKGYWLIGLENKLASKKNYQSIESTIIGDSSYIWAMNQVELKTSQASTEIDIYSAKGLFLRQIKIDKLFTNRRLAELFYTFFYSPIYYSEVYGSHQLIPQSLHFMQVNNKWGAFNNTGIVQIPFEYEQYGGRFLPNRADSLEFYQLKKDDKFGIINELNETVIPFIYDKIIPQWNNSNLTYFESETGYSLSNSNGDFIVKNASHIYYKKVYRNQESLKLDLSVTRSSNYYSDHDEVIFLRENHKLYCLYQDSLILCDSTTMHFDNPSVLFEKMLLFKDGSIQENDEGWTINATSSFYLESKYGKAKVMNFEGKRLKTIRKFEYAVDVRNKVKIRNTEGDVGLLSHDGRKWILKPNYFEIIINEALAEKNLFWAQIWTDSLRTAFESYKYVQQEFKGNWMLVNEKGRNYFDSLIFDYPFLPDADFSNTSIFSFNDRLGVLDSNMQIILPPKYNAIAPLSTFGHFAIQKDSTWALFNLDGTTSHFYDEVIYNDYPKSFKVEKTVNGQLLTGFVSHTDTTGYYECIPLSTPSEIIYDFDLAEKIKFTAEGMPNGYKTRYVTYFISTLDTFQRFHEYKIQYNNQLITTYFNKGLNNLPSFNNTYFNYFKTTSYQNGNVTLSHNGWNAKEGWFHKNLYYAKPFRTRTVELIHNASFVYSVRIKPGINDNFQPHFVNYHFGVSNEPIVFYDLFESKQAIDSFLYDYLENYVNDRQFYGLKCVDFSSVYSNYIQNFLIVPNGIAFKEGALPSNSANISFDLLVPYLKEEVKAYGAWNY